jgi:hypothetical protein
LACLGLSLKHGAIRGLNLLDWLIGEVFTVPGRIVGVLSPQRIAEPIIGFD